MGHSRDNYNAPVATAIPFVNFSVITDPCNDDWFGVTCEASTSADALPGATDNRTVTQMWLYSNNLQGAVPLSIQDLIALRSFSLGSNKLVGTVPRDVWRNMTELRYLSLAENALEGAIPETLGRLSQLEELRLHANQLVGQIPSELGYLGKLKSISVHANQLDGELPSELGNIGALQYVWVSSNNLTGAVPSQIGKLSRLRYLWSACRPPRASVGRACACRASARRTCASRSPTASAPSPPPPVRPRHHRCTRVHPMRTYHIPMPRLRPRG
jgi:hypothetical protein